MNELQTFENELFKVSAKVKGEHVLFEVEHVAKSLGFTQIKNNKEYIRWETVNRYLEKFVSQEVGKGDFIPEALVYKLAFKAQNDVAERFQDWLAIEVIPSIRKHGAYMTPETIEQALLNPDTIIQLATNLKSEQEQRRKLEEQKKRDEPYTTFGKVVATSDASINIGAFAKLLYDKHGIKMGRNKLFAWMRERGYLMRSGREKNQPKQQYIQRGLFETTVSLISRTYGDVESVTTMITGKGQIEIAKKIMEEEKIRGVI